MNLQQTFTITPETLAKQQHDDLKYYAVNILKKLTTLLEAEKYNDAKDMTFFSPAGDGMGLDNTCISFGEITLNPGHTSEVDIGAILDRLSELAKIRGS